MCSRFSLTSPPDVVRRLFGYDEQPDFPPRYNIAPGQPVAIVRSGPNGRRQFHLVRWGLIPSWVKDPGAFAMLVNARAESLDDKPSFRGAVRHKRCLVAADGFYEWTGTKGSRRPYFVRPRAPGPIAFAALYEEWMGADGSEIDTMAIVSVPANRIVATIHDRMPAILPVEAFADWLDCRNVRADEAMRLLAPAPDDLLSVFEVSTAVNDPGAHGPELQLPLRPTLF